VGATIAVSRCARWALAAVAASVAVGFPGASGAAAASYAKGLDVSHWNGAVDWIQVVGGGYSFLFAKATEGVTLTDPTYSINRAGAKGLGLRFGAYHFARPGGSSDAAVTASAIAQADHLVDVAQPLIGELPPVLDLETSGGLSQTALARWTQAWLDEVEARTGVSGLIYASPSFWKSKVGDTTSFAGSGHRLWIAHWTKNASPTVPAANWGGFGWTFWQWTDCSQIPGFIHCVDGDRLNGANPATYAIARYPTGAPVAATPPTITGTARAGSALAGVPGTWGGGKPIGFTYQWKRCDAAGAGCTPILGATLESYTPGAADVGHALVATVVATSPSGTAGASSPPTPAVAPAGSSVATRPAVIVAPAVSGLAQAGQTLTTFAGSWTGSPSSFAYQWRRCDATGAACVPIAAATVSSYTLTPDDIGTTLSVVVTATGKGGSQSATAPTTGIVAAAPVPPAVVGSAAAVQGAAGAVVTDDGRATVTWQPGAVPIDSTVSLTAGDALPALAGTGVTVDIQPPLTQLPWPVDVAYAAAPPDQIVGFSTDGRVWLPVAALTGTTLPAGLTQGTYLSGSELHVLTEQPGRLALFAPGKWGDPTLVSALAPVLRRLQPAKATRQPGRTLLLVTQMSVSSQADLYAHAYGPGGTRPSFLPRGSVLALPLHGAATKTARTRFLTPGAFTVRLRLSARGLTPGAHAKVTVTAIDPWGRRASFGLGFVVPRP
jgi:GH25 family lysozyme M1 (1,4-beta-N-acetylmuramidase)